jgi:hypothetical protein
MTDDSKKTVSSVAAALCFLFVMAGLVASFVHIWQPAALPSAAWGWATLGVGGFFGLWSE